mgnify:CR=1 FL=1
MTKYEYLLNEADSQQLITVESPLRANKGRIVGDMIAIKSDMTDTEKQCVMAEELGHYYTSVGDILDQITVENRKQELKARLWAYKRLLPLDCFISAFRSGCNSLYEYADYLNVTETFLRDAIRRYKQIYGTDWVRFDNYAIQFCPELAIMVIF